MIDSEDEVRTWITTLPGYQPEASERLTSLVDLLLVENISQNLIAASSVAHVWQRHIADSLQLLRFVPRGTSVRWLDLGSGGGFPGLVLGAFDPTLAITLVESRRRRIDWLQRASEELGLINVDVVGQRLEQIEPRYYDVITARAFAPLSTLIDLASLFSGKRTTWILPKGRRAQSELDELTGWRHVFHVEQSITDPHAGIIVGNLLAKDISA
jgi:16S rRNA (guanine527-N7)-methyltransferase